MAVFLNTSSQGRNPIPRVWDAFYWSSEDDSGGNDTCFLFKSSGFNFTITFYLWKEMLDSMCGHSVKFPARIYFLSEKLGANFGERKK